MLAVARARFVRVSARKARLVLDQIRNRPVGEALATLEFTPRAAARLIEKVLRSAVANAEHNFQMRNLDDLRVVQAIADGGPSMKRVQPRAMGRAFFIKHRTSHLTIGVSDETNGSRAVAHIPRRRAVSRRTLVSVPAAAPAPATKAAPPARRATATRASGKKPAARTPKSKETR
ncbi:MAG: 50S ribosomal protein L22 [Candidatus Rokuibacteriota bacterium]